jgi:predicted transcriptional regulator
MARKPKTKPSLSKGEELRAFRESRGINQTDFWAPFHVTQSGASRYEAGRRVPAAVLTLIEIAYGTDQQAAAIVKRLRAGRDSGE